MPTNLCERGRVWQQKRGRRENKLERHCHVITELCIASRKKAAIQVAFILFHPQIIMIAVELSDLPFIFFYMLQVLYDNTPDANWREHQCKIQITEWALVTSGPQAPKISYHLSALVTPGPQAPKTRVVA